MDPEIKKNGEPAPDEHELDKPTPAEERQVVRKTDFNLVPLVSVLFLVSFLDRSNIGNANTAGLSETLGMSPGQYDWLLTIFYITYILGQFTTLGWKVFKPHYWCTFLVFSWGLVAMCQGGTSNWSGMMALRALLGFFETAYGPDNFYRRRELGIRQGVFLSMAPLASCFSGALAYGITSGHSKIEMWRVLFIVEGAPCIILAVFTYFFIPDTAATARFLNDRDKQVASYRSSKSGKESHGSNKLNLSELKRGFLDIHSWFTALMYFSVNVSYSSLPVFLPTIIHEMGFESIDSQGLSAPPYLLSFFVLLTCSHFSDKLGQRGYFIIGLSTLSAIGYVVLATTDSVGARYTGVYLAAAGMFPTVAIILPWVSNMQETDSKRGAGFVLLNLIGQCGPLLGTRVFPAAEGPYYRKGMWISAAFLFFVAFLAAVLRTLLAKENNKRDRLYGKVDPDEADGMDFDNEVEHKKLYRYIL